MMKHPERKGTGRRNLEINGVDSVRVIAKSIEIPITRGSSWICLVAKRASFVAYIGQNTIEFG